MSLSVGGFYGGYAHPTTMGLTSAQDYFRSAQYPNQSFGYPGFPEYTDMTDRERYHNWVLNGAQGMTISPEVYSTPNSTPSPSGMSLGQMAYEERGSWQDYPLSTAELAFAHNIPLSELGSYESYTDAFGERCIRRRSSANRKERRRTLSINNAFSNLRCSIPNVPSDTKLSKIKTLRLAISYISYLTKILEKGDSEVPEEGFVADISRKKNLVSTEDQKIPDSCVSTVDKNTYIHVHCRLLTYRIMRGKKKE